RHRYEFLRGLGDRQHEPVVELHHRAFLGYQLEDAGRHVVPEQPERVDVLDLLHGQPGLGEGGPHALLRVPPDMAGRDVDRAHRERDAGTISTIFPPGRTSWRMLPSAPTWSSMCSSTL